ncbi:MAG: tRNA preQ1(34) S-adenosylmethionine ribosyltransferase-isomerase QueA [Alphaproteobacteria bacterium]|nr:tRNA preQ1(34) S-adenosylmethionine ribosyltransferase-isomerase QueA [Alphaproteobacteria bacterium]
MKVDLFDFELPIGLIAQSPARPRDSARMMTVPKNGPIGDHGVLDLADHLHPGDLMVFNNTKVIPARLIGHKVRKDSRGSDPDGPGAKIDVTLHKADGANCWRAFVRPARKLKVGDHIQFAREANGDFRATVAEKFDGGEISLVFNRAKNDLREALRQYGAMPLPPYIHRDGLPGNADASDYQTLYAEHEGAVAAPTAGLHFTDRLFDSLQTRGVARTFVTLHVGAGTFLPVKADDTVDHRMHAEWGEVSQDAANAINQTRSGGGRIVAVGTTALRLLESAAMPDGTIAAFSGDTDIFITPGYSFRAVDVLMTNFHLPRSTLFMLVSAFAGLNRMQAAYAHATKQAYRFYSYGDACLLERA